MITKKQFERFRDFYATLRPLVIEKLNEKLEIEYGRPLSEKEEIIDIEYSLDDGVFLVTTDESYSCGHDTNYYNVEPKYLYDENAMQELKKEVEERKRKEVLEKEIKARDDKKKKMEREVSLMHELAEKYGCELIPQSDGD